MIADDVRAEIRRLFYAEHWRVGTIASELGLHASTVRHAIETERFRSSGSQPRPSALDPYMDLIRKTLEEHPRLRATRIHEMVAARGYAGSVVQTRRAVRRLRPQSKAEAYLRLRPLPGEEAQVDWGHFGTIQVGRARHRLSAFVMVLSYSRALHVLFTLDQTMESFLRGHVEAFGYFGGVPRALLYDNLKSAVTARRGKLIELHPRMLELAGHYHFQPKPCAVGRGNEKGRVERQIRFLRDRFFAARSFRDVDDLNAQFERWRTEWAHARPCPGEPERAVAEVLGLERALLLPLPEHPFDTTHTRAVSSGKTPYVRFDLNDYSIPHDRIRRPLTLAATYDEVRILDGAQVLARHPRSYDARQHIEDRHHIAALVAEKGWLRERRGRDMLSQHLCHAEAFLAKVLERGMPLAAAVGQLFRMLDDVGPKALDAAIAEAIARGTPTPASVAHIVETARRCARRKPKLPVTLPDRPDVRDLRTPTHRLETYDDLGHDDPDSQ
jgi:transposase